MPRQAEGITCDPTDGSKSKCATCLAGFKLTDDGGCAKCSAGTFGMECGTACSATDAALNCDHGGVTCDSTAGRNVKCTGCKAGFHTDGSVPGQCMAPCSDQKYGADCAQACTGLSTKAKKKTNCGAVPYHTLPGTLPWACDSKTGATTSCVACASGFYGPACDAACTPAPENCNGDLENPQPGRYTCDQAGNGETTCAPSPHQSPRVLSYSKMLRRDATDCAARRTHTGA
jgi:hypothetical protein